MKHIKRIKCLIVGHDWNKVHGMGDSPEVGAVCLRCGKKK